MVSEYNKFKEWLKEAEDAFKFITSVSAVLTILVIVKQCGIMQKQNEISESLAAYTKHQDSIQHKNDSIRDVKDSVNKHINDSLLGIAMENSRKQIELAQRIHELTDRPSIALYTIKLISRIEPGQKAKIEIRMKNSGKVDAINVRTCSTFAFDSLKIEDERMVHKCNFDKQYANIPPGDDVKMNFEPTKVFTENDLEDIGNNKKYMSMMVWSEYNDFEKSKVYKYRACTYFSVKENTWVACPNIKTSD